MVFSAESWAKCFLTLVPVTEAKLHLSQLVSALYFWDELLPAARAERTRGPAGEESGSEQAAKARHGASRSPRKLQPGGGWGSAIVPGH